MLVRDAIEKDVDSINHIYNYEVLNGVATFDTEPKTYEERLEWLNHHSPKYPCIVVEKDGKTLAWGPLTQYSPRKAYDGTCEISIYVDKESRGMGLGKIIIAELLERAKNNGIHVILSRVAGENEASKTLHINFGFELVGILKEVGYKFDRYIDVNFYQKLIK